MSSVDFYHPHFTSPTDHIPAMNWVKDAIEEEHFEGKAFAMSQPYSRWEIDEVYVWDIFEKIAKGVR